MKKPWPLPDVSPLMNDTVNSCPVLCCSSSGNCTARQYWTNLVDWVFAPIWTEQKILKDLENWNSWSWGRPPIVSICFANSLSGFRIYNRLTAKKSPPTGAKKQHILKLYLYLYLDMLDLTREFTTHLIFSSWVKFELSTFRVRCLVSTISLQLVSLMI